MERTAYVMPFLGSEFASGLNTDLYELTMAAGYFENKVDLKATFELYCHRMPPNRSFIMSGGLRAAVDYVLNFQFSSDEIHFLESLPAFKNVSPAFFDYLSSIKFTGDVYALAEGEVVFANEPLLQVTAPIIEAQILETYLLSIFNIHCLVASKAARIVKAAVSDGKARSVVDFGSRRAHGPQAGVMAAYAAYLAGCIGTSNVLAGKTHGIPVFGTMAHSWVSAFKTEEEAFIKYSKVFPDNTILLIDTYDTLKAIRKVIALKDQLKVKAVRIDSGNLYSLSVKVRQEFDANGLKGVKIIASGNLNEYKIEKLVKQKAPIDIFGVGTEMSTSRDDPALDLTYKLVQVEDRESRVKYTFKTSSGKETLPGRKQVFRQLNPQGHIRKDVIGLFKEGGEKGFTPLLQPIIKDGKLLQSLPSLEESRQFAQSRLLSLSKSFFDLRKIKKFDVPFSPQIKRLKA